MYRHLQVLTADSPRRARDRQRRAAPCALHRRQFPALGTGAIGPRERIPGPRARPAPRRAATSKPTARALLLPRLLLLRRRFDTTLELERLVYLNGLGEDEYGNDLGGAHILLEATALGRKNRQRAVRRTAAWAARQTAGSAVAHRASLCGGPRAAGTRRHGDTQTRAGFSRHAHRLDLDGSRRGPVSPGVEHVFRELRAEHPEHRVPERRDLLPDARLHWRSDTRALLGQNVAYLLPGTDRRGVAS